MAEWFADNLYEHIEQVFTQELYESLDEKYRDKVAKERNEFIRDIKIKMNNMTEEFEKKWLEKDERDKIERILRLALLDYFKKEARTTYLNDVMNVSSISLITFIKKNYPMSDIDTNFLDKSDGAKLVYALKFNIVQNKTKIPISAIEKYIQYNQNVHFHIRPFKINGYLQIRDSLIRIKNAGIILDDEKEINEICNLLTR